MKVTKEYPYDSSDIETAIMMWIMEETAPKTASRTFDVELVGERVSKVFQYFVSGDELFDVAHHEAIFLLPFGRRNKMWDNRIEMKGYPCFIGKYRIR